MKLLRLIFLIAAIVTVTFSHTNAQWNSNLYALDPMWGPSGAAHIDEATISVRPHGAYVEYGMYLTISPQIPGYQTVQDTFELYMHFSLPEKAHIIDSWLWVDSIIMKALLIDRAEATAIYESFVNRRTDPSLLVKQGNNNYRIQIFPAPGNLSRKIKITYMAPAQLSSGKMVAKLPLHIIKYSPVLPDINLVVYTDGLYPTAEIEQSGITTLSPGGANTFVATIPGNKYANEAALTVAFPSPIQNGFFTHYYPVDSNEGYYQFVMLPDQALNMRIPKKRAILLNHVADDITTQQVIDGVSEMLANYYDTNDSFNVFYYSSNAIQSLSNDWIPADPAVYKNLLLSLKVNNAFGNTSNVTTALTAVQNFIISKGGGGDILLISNLNNPSISASSLQVPVHVFFYSYYPNSSYVQLANSTGGKFRHINYNWYGIPEEFSSGLNSLNELTEHKLSSYNMQMLPQNGFSYKNYSVYGNQELILTKPYMQTGKYFGTPPFNVTLNYLDLNGAVQGTNFTLNPSPGDTMVRKMWGAAFIENLEALSNVNFSKEIIDTSRSHRVLSLYTAFLALEPNDTLLGCRDCTDESSTTFPGAVSVAENKKQNFNLTAYPNPFTDQIIIALNIPGNTGSKGAHVRILNLLGQEVHLFEIDIEGQKEIQLTWNGKDKQGKNLAPGVYFIILEVDSVKQHVKVVKQ